jgi:transposase
MKGFLGIDVSKGYADFYLINEVGSDLEPSFQLDDTHKGHSLLFSWLRQSLSKHKLTSIDCAVESTGGFENNWYCAFVEWSSIIAVRVARLNPSVVKNAAKAELRVNVTDVESAKNIAFYIKRFNENITFNDKPSEYAAFRTLHNHLTLVVKQKVQLVNQLKQLLYSCSPELQRYCKEGVPSWVLSLLKTYPTAQKLSAASTARLMKIKSISEDKAKRIINSAKMSNGSRQSPVDEFVVKMTVREIEQKQLDIEDLKDYLSTKCDGPETKLLQSIKGIGAYSAAAIMIQIEDISRFKTAKALASFFGLHPTIRESGDKQSKSRMSKRGRPTVRAILFMCANSAVLCDNHMKNIYAKHRAKGKNHKQALGAVMHKMLRVIWGVLSSGKAYDSSIDADNQSKKVAIDSNFEIQSFHNKRRLQEIDQDAPISRLAHKKRKASFTSQASSAEQIRDLESRPSV